MALVIEFDHWPSHERPFVYTSERFGAHDKTLSRVFPVECDKMSELGLKVP